MLPSFVPRQYPEQHFSPSSIGPVVFHLVPERLAYFRVEQQARVTAQSLDQPGLLLQVDPGRWQCQDWRGQDHCGAGLLGWTVSLPGR